MPGGVIHADWLNDNRNRRYPFLDWVTLRDSSSSMEIPNELLVDLVFPIHSGEYDPSQFYLRQLTIFAGGIVLSLGHESESEAIAVRSVTLAEHSENRTYYLEGRGAFEGSIGRIAIGRLDKIRKYGGTYTFNPDATRLLPTLMRPSLRGVTGIRVVSADNEESDLLQGDIEIMAGSNVELEVLSGGSGQPKQLRISAVNNPSFEQECDCGDVPNSRCIERINNIPPDDTGNFGILGEGCVTVEDGNAAITLRDTCAQPCCGCAELEVLRVELNRLGGQIATERAFAQRAFSSIEQLRTSILASRIGTIVPCT